MARTIEVSREELEEIAYNSGAPLFLPGNRAGFAHLTVAGRRYRAFLAAPRGVAS